MHTSSRLKEVTMEDIPNITNDMPERFKELHIDSVYQLAVQTPFQLALNISDGSFNIESVSSLIGNARKIHVECEILKEFSTVNDLSEKRNKKSRCATGSEKFDALLNGGFETQAMTEIADDLAAKTDL